MLIEIASFIENIIRVLNYPIGNWAEAWYTGIVQECKYIEINDCGYYIINCGIYITSVELEWIR